MKVVVPWQHKFKFKYQRHVISLNNSVPSYKISLNSAFCGQCGHRSDWRSVWDEGYICIPRKYGLSCLIFRRSPPTLSLFCRTAKDIFSRIDDGSGGIRKKERNHRNEPSSLEISNSVVDHMNESLSIFTLFLRTSSQRNPRELWHRGMAIIVNNADLI